MYDAGSARPSTWGKSEPMMMRFSPSKLEQACQFVLVQRRNPDMAFEGRPGILPGRIVKIEVERSESAVVPLADMTSRQLIRRAKIIEAVAI